MPIVLPHELLHCLDQCGKLRELCDQRDLADYWAHFHSNVSMHVQWPVEAPMAQLAVPLGLHGDDCRYTDTNQKIIILSMNILVDKTQQRFPLVVIRHATRLCNYIMHVYSMYVLLVMCCPLLTAEALSAGFPTLQAFIKPVSYSQIHPTMDHD